MRPSGSTAVASTNNNAAPDKARWPRWIMCQSVAQPASAEYSHMGAITMRLASRRGPAWVGVNNWLMRKRLRAMKRTA